MIYKYVFSLFVIVFVLFFLCNKNFIVFMTKRQFYAYLAARFVLKTNITKSTIKRKYVIKKELLIHLGINSKD